jgi:hexosaminidase
MTQGPALFPAVVINDQPRFGYRGMHLDVSRHFFPISFVKEYLDMMALHNMNTFHWHLTDDQGWRIESKKFPRLHEIGSKRRHTVIGRNTGLFDDTPYGGYYTQEQLREVVRYAEERCINVIPEVELPGHALAILAAYPELGCTGGPYETEPTWGVFDDILCAGNEKSFELLCGVMDEIADIFPSKYINIGGDEAPKKRWEQCAKCQKRIQEQGIHGDSTLTAEAKLQGYFTNRMEQYIKKLGRSIIGWDEILQGGLAPDATVMSWHGIEAGLQAVKEGHDVIFTPTHYYYLDYHQDPAQFRAVGRLVSLEKVYSFEPMAKDISEADAHHVLGVQGNLWTEHVQDAWHAEMLLYPRVFAIAETGWSQAEKKNWPDFERRASVLSAVARKWGYTVYHISLTD